MTVGGHREEVASTGSWRPLGRSPPHIQPSCFPDGIYFCYLSSQICDSLLWQPLEKFYTFVLLWQPFKIKVGLAQTQCTDSFQLIPPPVSQKVSSETVSSPFLLVAISPFF